MAHRSTEHHHHPAGLTPLLTPGQVAKILGCSEWWVKEQARNRRIPFTRAGGAYRFTTEHVHEIVRIFEQRPAEPAGRGTIGRQHRPVAQPANPVVELRARPPRRARDST